ncbi:hypothetical protein N7509_000486 [Penicillium cosmopolitanum]|uniref:Uncharacterized protein n=1 Tax=Penicillium cosmopolitanum TaxID=1131564 RepID=A0A9X0BE38_9EURO|nr:uncharacterized protein N7509_000478 [Penicillium cosmopolitanum]XP_056493704.1 uncharacterized protein N7509_000482 [Penicillium cosmopolitanum]XP_056493706.1 uncharacterized protein N7509_000486 [Penicillium cosmopolitanum]KAJ5413851.1 hypothetical protein N7509_000478 [Penicillium cosmopolitanum]KAJ5413855.1 hypothetical protein N7509_000482 [Penicillium cosmopolitanum]KAJ5413859.1 hypothetical protein N7509_000486 [Penicillium cosmopolitanum]
MSCTDHLHTSPIVTDPYSNCVLGTERLHGWHPPNDGRRPPWVILCCRGVPRLGFGPGVGVAVAPEARGPFGLRHRWSLWTDGRWPHLKPDSWGGAAPWDPPFAGVVHGVRTLHPRAVCRSPPPPARAAWRDHCVRTGAEGLSGGNWMAARVTPGTPGAPRRPGASCAPS